MKEFFNQLISFFQQLLEMIINLYNQYRVVIIAILVFLIALVITQIAHNILFIIDTFKNIFSWIYEKIIINIWKLLKLIGKGIKYVLMTYSRWKHRKELQESMFNVIPHPYKIPLLYRLLSRRIRRQRINRIYCIEKCIKTKDYIKNNFSYISMVDASVGGGKTSFLNGYSHNQNVLLIEKIEDDLNSIEKKIYTADYVKLRAAIALSYKNGDSEEHAFDIIVKDESISSKFEGYYDDYVSKVPTESLLKKYIIAYRAKLRNNYTMCNYRLFNRITKSYNYELPPDLFNIKDPEAQKKFFIPAYCVILDDEKALSDFKNTETPKELDKLGTDNAMRLFRQMREETTYYISSTQNTSRIAMLLRELANTYISILSFSIVGEQNHLANHYRLKQEKLKEKMIKFANRTFKDDEIAVEKYLLTDNPFKEKINYWFLKERELFASAFVKYKILIAKKLGDLQTEKALELECCFPLTWVFGVYRKCEYSDFYEFLNNLSNIKSDHELKVITSLFEDSTEKYKNMIKVKSKEKEEKKPKTKKKEA